MNATAVAEAVVAQKALVLSPHPLQRVGAYALASLACVKDLDEVTPERFDQAVERMTDEAEKAALKESTNDEGAFWLKASYSFFPNSPINHPSRGRKSYKQIREEVRAWHRMPDPDSWPGWPCALCGRAACGLYGKSHVPLQESASQRNTTPPRQGDEGLPLCFACLCSFYALPYGCQLSGGSSAALFSWDESFLRRVTRRQYRETMRAGSLAGAPTVGGMDARRIVALKRLRAYDSHVTEDVDLLVFQNHNQTGGQFIERHSLTQPLAEWLRRTMSEPALRRGFWWLVRAHQAEKRSGSARLAYHAFEQPDRILGTCVERLRAWSEKGRPLPAGATDLVDLCYSYANAVMKLDRDGTKLVKVLADKVALTLSQTDEAGPLSTFRARHRRPSDLQAWFRVHAIRWTLGRYKDDEGRPTSESPEPLITTDQWRILFDPDGTQNWAHQQLLFIAVLERLHARGWRPDEAEETPDDVDTTTRSEELREDEEER